MSARDEAVEMIRRICPPHLSADEYGRILAEKFDVHRTEVLAEAIAAVESERLRDDTDHPEDKAYCQAIDDVADALERLTSAAAEVVPLIVARFDTAIEPAPEEEPVLTIGCIAEDGRPVALLLDVEDRRRVACWLAPELEKATAAAATATPDTTETGAAS